MANIRNEIDQMVRAGHKIEDLLINEGNERWGDDCVVTIVQAQDTLASWEREGQDCNELEPLIPAAEWIERNPA